jgi:hypothetical protein
VSLYRVYADDTGETRLARLELPLRADDDGPRRCGLPDVPATTVSISELLETKPDTGLHPAPRRQFVVVLRGELEVTTTSGDAQRFGPGDCLFADDVDTKGHFTREVGSDPLSTLTIGVARDWEFPGLPA